MVKRVIIDLPWVSRLNEDLSWDDEYFKILETITVQDVIMHLLSLPIRPITLDADISLLSDLMGYFPCGELNEEKISLLMDFITELLSHLSSQLYSDLYYHFNADVDKVQYEGWLDDVSIVLRINKDAYWE